MDGFESDLYDYMKRSSHSKYRQQDCFKLCRQKLIITQCGCYYAKYSMLIQSPPCLNVSQLDCILMQSADFSDDYTRECALQCPLECDTTIYEQDVSSLTFPSRQLYNIYENDSDFMAIFKYLLNTSASYDAFRSIYLVLNVYYPLTQYTEIEVTPKFTPFDLLAQIGGVLGMFVGFSLFHLVEIGEILFLLVKASVESAVNE